MLFFWFQWSKNETHYPIQTVVSDIKTLPLIRSVPKTLAEAFPIGSKVIVLAQPYFGALGDIIQVPVSGNEAIKVTVLYWTDPDIKIPKLMENCKSEDYMPGKF